MRYKTLLTLTAAVIAIASTSGCDRKSEVATDDEPVIKPSIHIPKPVEHYEGTPYWLEQSRNWPQFMELAVDRDGSYAQDSLLMRITGTVLQSFVDGPKAKNHPLMCWMELTIRPIPRKLVGYSFNIDSVVFFDPLKRRAVPSLPMLSAERHTEKGVVRTMFSNNLAVVRSPELVENQLLEPTVYLTSVGKKVMKITLPPIVVTYLMEIDTDPIPTDSLKWGPL